jgi:hypothetical protein
MTRFLLLSDSCGYADVGHPLRQEDGSVVYNCCWSSPAKSFSGSSPMGLETIFYCLRFKTSLFIASYDSQGYNGGIRPHLLVPCMHVLYHASGSPSSAVRFLTHREDLYDMTDSSWVSIQFQSQVFRFYSTDGASGR